MTLILLALFLASGWVLTGWLFDDRADEAEYSAAHPPRHADHRSTVLIGGSR